MGRAKDRIELMVAVAAVPGQAVQQRARREHQREAVEQCKAMLRLRGAGIPDISPGAPPPGHLSISHSRGLAVVAAVSFGAAPARDHRRIGIDAEYIDPARNWTKIIQTLSGDPVPALSPAQGASIWTYYEAVFKATGAVPGKDAIARQVAELTAPSRPAGPPATGGRVTSWSFSRPFDMPFAISVAVTPPVDDEGPGQAQFVWLGPHTTGAETGGLNRLVPSVRKSIR